MRRYVLLSLLLPGIGLPASNAFVGNWDFDVPTPNGVGANWIGISEGSNGQVEVWFQPTGGNVFQVHDYNFNGSQMTLRMPNDVWELKLQNGKLVGTETHNGKTIQVTGKPSPKLDRNPPAKWGPPQPIFDGKDLKGWEPIGSPDKNHWVVEDGDLVNKERGANLRTVKTFNDFKLHFEVNCPADGNSGFYLRGRYEVQIEYERSGENPPERSIGSIYGRIAPSVAMPRAPGKWQTFDVTLVGRTVTIVQNGTTIIDHKVIDGITGGALNADEGAPGPFYIQGDHTAGIRYRNITVSLPE